MVDVISKKDDGKEDVIPAKIVYVRNTKKKKDWVALICTNTELSENEIVRIYGKRWQTEVFYKTCKSWLKLGKECRSLSYDAMTAHVAIVFARYMLLSIEQRKDTDERSICELFYVLCDELADITYSESLHLIVNAMLESLRELFHFTDELSCIKLTFHPTAVLPQIKFGNINICISVCAVSYGTLFSCIYPCFLVS